MKNHIPSTLGSYPDRPLENLVCHLHVLHRTNSKKRGERDHIRFRIRFQQVLQERHRPQVISHIADNLIEREISGIRLTLIMDSRVVSPSSCCALDSILQSDVVRSHRIQTYLNITLTCIATDIFHSTPSFDKRRTCVGSIPRFNRRVHRFPSPLSTKLLICLFH